MGITRTTMIDDDGSGTTGTILNNAWKQELYGQIDAAPLTTTYGTFVNIGSVAGVNHNFNPANSADKIVWYVTAAAGAEITGVLAAPAGTMHLIYNDGSPLLFRQLNAGSAAANQIIGPGFTDYTLQPWASLTLFRSHTANNWVIINV
jgi:hypothetical protein